MSKSDNDTHATLAYENAGREITQAFESMNSNLTLAGGTLAAVLTILGAVELRDTAPTISPNHIPQLSAVSLLVLAASVPLLSRFFIRSLIAYQNLIRFNGVQSAAWKYLTGRSHWQRFDRHVELYVLKWRSPKRLTSLIWEQLKYGFFWVLVIASAAIAWGFYSVDANKPQIVAGAILGVGLLWEFITLFRSRVRYFVTLSDTEIAWLHEDANDDDGVTPDVGTAAHEEVEATVGDQAGLFIGWQRLRRRRQERD